ncbi:SDR family NAD(P)-dependent oxidoreductase [Paeniglutamicibacter psychrophenolicus]|uniref:SDR family NAD(P)-dependent oxidoreductase n=1 Tax=Paeniglutamicibacter psychrophenolicus TaxID=257454 RepID=UPI00277F0575|nr:SDR family oxidoreductase [Paeniglutamicibacter psychrophenolicus]MDQ0094488.1 NADP-dependent 3-hydroxy acid dehydrogenase YdfG [Paeniglutamicibacter psychrophenolicus]
MADLKDLTILIAGASSASGVAAAHALCEAGATVLAAGSNAERLAQRLPFVHGRYEVDLANHAAVTELHALIDTERGPIDGLLHLVGGWRGGKGLAGQSDDDAEFLHTQVVTTLRNTTRVFRDDLVASRCGRVAIVSAAAVDSPSGSNANYTTAKAGAEAWMRSVAAELRTAQSGSKTAPVPQRAAALTWVIKAFTDAAGREAHPERNTAGFTDVTALGQAAVELFTADASAINGARINLPSL